jgi:hypothetical protein
LPKRTTITANFNGLIKLRSILFWVLVIGGLSAAVWAYFHLKQTKKPALNAIDVLPDSALCVISSNNFEELANKISNQNLVWQELIGIPEFKEINAHLTIFDSVITENQNLKDFFSKRSLFMAVYDHENSSAIVIVFNLNDEAQQEEFMKTVSSVFKGTIDQNGDFSFPIERTNYYLRASRGVVAITNTKHLIEHSFNEKSKKQKANEEFASLKKLLDKENVCNAYINFERVAVAKTKIKTSELIFSGQAICDVEFNPAEITFNGFNTPDSASILNTLVAQQPQSCDFLSILPFNTIGYKAVGISDYALWKKQLKISPEQTAKFWKTINDSAMFNVERQLTDNIGSKLLEVQIKYNAAVSKAFVCEVKDTADINEIIKFISDSVTAFQNIKTGHLKDRSLVEALCGKMFSVSSAYAFVFGNYFVVTESKEANEYFISSAVNNAMASQNETFMNYAKDNLNANFNYQYYSVPNKDLPAIKAVFGFIKDEQLKTFDKLSDLSITFSNYKNVLQFRTNLKYQQASNNKETPGLWMFEADTLITSKTFTFVNHKSNENELLVQDAKNDLYLINATGNSLWKKRINETVASDIYTIDAFRNGKYQLLFNTANYLHLIDRNGNYVAGFPVKLPSRATNSLTVFDYENTKEYRLMIACADKTIYNYNSNGTKNDKFAPIKMQNEANLPVQYVKVGASDYLVTCDVDGKIYVCSRRGAGRIDFKNNVLEHSGNYFVDAGNNIENTKIVYLDDKNSLLESITFSDKKTAAKLSEEFEEATYSFEKIDDDKKTDIMILDRSKLKCYDFSGNELFSYENLDYTYRTATYFYDTDGAYFVLSTVGGEVHLVPAGTKSISKKIKGTGVPLVSDLFKDGKKYVLIPEDKTLKCVLLK